MHRVIRAIVFAENQKEALEKAKMIFDDLCGESGEPFDYYATFEKGDQGIAARERWGNFLAVVEATSEKGKQLIEEGLETTKRELLENLAKVRSGLAKLSDEDIWQDKDARDEENTGLNFEASMLRYFISLVGQDRGPSVLLYDNDGEGIKSPKHLSNVWAKWQVIYEGVGKENPYKNMEIYVVPADVHY